ncbi:uncharacterized protein MYCFIDRAFT_176643 [Pseudocercospora fijiensis CIRAD86]|uniref:Uncharacterized protein n=1 Tax=Pseudocercospora fijiensis (strain CIRAD86) TaxID=383855 RepID=M3A9P9_PSEFD|nr:uncharacterized protein MYCFIDRAFT_176643 [Pseudocercospora fijiensis CIRAD86]EME81361.1 hypothetical protein MYCFIDRAFT_176643 [Pseudocercospora fijiensis CIRAD86]
MLEYRRSKQARELLKGCAYSYGLRDLGQTRADTAGFYSDDEQVISTSSACRRFLLQSLAAPFSSVKNAFMRYDGTRMRQPENVDGATCILRWANTQKQNVKPRCSVTAASPLLLWSRLRPRTVIKRHKSQEDAVAAMGKVDCGLNDACCVMARTPDFGSCMPTVNLVCPSLCEDQTGKPFVISARMHENDGWSGTFDDQDIYNCRMVFGPRKLAAKLIINVEQKQISLIGAGLVLVRLEARGAVVAPNQLYHRRGCRESVPNCTEQHQNTYTTEDTKSITHDGSRVLPNPPLDVLLLAVDVESREQCQESRPAVSCRPAVLASDPSAPPFFLAEKLFRLSHLNHHFIHTSTSHRPLTSPSIARDKLGDFPRAQYDSWLMKGASISPMKCNKVWPANQRERRARAAIRIPEAWHAAWEHWTVDPPSPQPPRRSSRLRQLCRRCSERNTVSRSQPETASGGEMCWHSAASHGTNPIGDHAFPVFPDPRGTPLRIIPPIDSPFCHPTTLTHDVARSQSDQVYILASPTHRRLEIPFSTTPDNSRPSSCLQVIHNTLTQTSTTSSSAMTDTMPMPSGVQIPRNDSFSAEDFTRAFKASATKPRNDLSLRIAPSRDEPSVPPPSPRTSRPSDLSHKLVLVDIIISDFIHQRPAMPLDHE